MIKPMATVAALALTSGLAVADEQITAYGYAGPPDAYGVGGLFTFDRRFTGRDNSRYDRTFALGVDFGKDGYWLDLVREPVDERRAYALNGLAGIAPTADLIVYAGLGVKQREKHRHVGHVVTTTTTTTTDVCPEGNPCTTETETVVDEDQSDDIDYEYDTSAVVGALYHFDRFAVGLRVSKQSVSLTLGWRFEL